MVLSYHLVFRVYLRHLLMNGVVVLVTLHVSEPYSSTFFTLVLRILILFRVENDDVFHTAFKMLNTCLAFPILFLSSSYVPPLLSSSIIIFSLQLYLSLLCTVHL